MEATTSSQFNASKRLDANTIDINEHYERRGWARSLGVTEEALIGIVKKYGTSAHRVRAYLRKRGNT